MNIEAVVHKLVEVMEDKKGKDPVVLDIQGISLIADYFVICHGNSDIQVKAIATEIKKKAEELDVDVKRIEGMDNGRWVLVDLGDIIIHVFHREEREYYNLERLWSDAKVVETV